MRNDRQAETNERRGVRYPRHVDLWLTEEMVESLDAWAQELERSRAWFIRQAIREKLDLMNREFGGWRKEIPNVTEAPDEELRRTDGGGA
jgi:primase-polymerase (primpol)-like protein